MGVISLALYAIGGEMRGTAHLGGEIWAITTGLSVGRIRVDSRAPSLWGNLGDYYRFISGEQK